MVSSSCSNILTKQSSSIHSCGRSVDPQLCIVVPIMALLQYLAGLLRIVPFRHQAFPESRGLPLPHNVAFGLHLVRCCGIHEPTPVIGQHHRSSLVCFLLLPPVSSTGLLSSLLAPSLVEDTSCCDAVFPPSCSTSRHTALFLLVYQLRLVVAFVDLHSSCSYRSTQLHLSAPE
jgi:hypothetical protein